MSGGWRSVWSNKDGRPHGLLSPTSQQASLVTGQSSERVGLLRPWTSHTFTSPVFCYSKQSRKANLDSGSGEIDSVYLLMGEAAKSNIKGHGYREKKGLGGGGAFLN